jgi:hypothetical protein
VDNEHNHALYGPTASPTMVRLCNGSSMSCAARVVSVCHCGMSLDSACSPPSFALFNGLQGCMWRLLFVRQAKDFPAAVLLQADVPDRI